jgi:predicted RNA binding protein YcfA (HicA-like mRNA interferase family)
VATLAVTIERRYRALVLLAAYTGLRAVEIAALSALRLHDLRHTCASLAIAAGADVKVLRRMLGHVSAALTLDGDDDSECPGCPLRRRFRHDPKRMKVGDIIRLIEADGWYFIRRRGSPRQYGHPTKPGRVMIAGKPGDDMAPGTLRSVLRQAGIERGGEEPEEGQ